MYKQPLVGTVAARPAALGGSLAEMLHFLVQLHTNQAQHMQVQDPIVQVVVQKTGLLAVIKATAVHLVDGMMLRPRSSA